MTIDATKLPADCEVWTSGDVTLIRGDCLAVLPAVSGVDAVVTDPPYGVNAVVRGKCFGTSNACKTNTYAPIVGDDKPFNPFHLLGIAPVTVLWGGNHYADKLPARARWLVWDKRDGTKSNPLADCELAWTSDTRPARLFSHRWMGMIRASERGKRIHPSQKPVALMEWVLETMAVQPASVVLDAYFGSCSMGVACVNLNRKFIGIEISPEYFEIAKARILKAQQAKAEQLVA